MSDLIDRAAAIDAIKAASKEIQHWLWEAEGCEGYCEMVADVETCLDDLPSVQPERKTGKWSVEFSPDYMGGAYCECLQCNCKFAMGAYFEPDEWKFCPDCGAEMRGEQDE